MIPKYENFTLKETGVFWLTDKKIEHFVCSYLKSLYKIFNQEYKSWHLLLLFKNKERFHRTWSMPQIYLCDAGRIKRALMAMEVHVSPGKNNLKRLGWYVNFLYKNEHNIKNE